jgi:serine protease
MGKQEAFQSVFEGFAIQVSRSTQESTLQTALASVLGSGWAVNPFGDRTDGKATRFDVTSSERKLSVSEAWQMSYQLRAVPGVLYAEPLFEVAISGRPDWNVALAPDLMVTGRFEEAFDPGLVLCGAGPNFKNLPESEEPEWSLKQMRVPEAWARFFSDSTKLPGQGVVIGHPDTGYQAHPEIVPNLLPEKGFDFLEDDPDPTDELEKPFGVAIPNPGHGTATSSVIISPRGDQDGNLRGKFVTGVAPGAKLIPIRMTYSVVLVGMMKLAQAIEHATNKGAHVISISLGGLGCWRLRSAITYAQKRGVIIAAAAGNCVKFVVWPAAYEEVIAVAACNAKREIWVGSCRGEVVDVTAPGESVWHAQVKKKDSGAIEPGVAQGNGTSFAVAAVAGLAALWLSYHDREKLIERYGIEKIPFLFNRILRESCDPVSDWELGKFGAGLVNAEKLLAAPLPERVEETVIAPALDLNEHIPLDWGGIEAFNHLFNQSLAEVQLEETDRTVRSNPVLENQLAELLNINAIELPRRLKEIGQELAFHFSTNPDVYKASASASAQQEAGTRVFELRNREMNAVLENLSMQVVRGMLLGKETSKGLKKKLLVIEQ